MASLTTIKDAIHEKYILQAISLAQSARDHGNHPFGALLVDPEDGFRVILTAENTVFVDSDGTSRIDLTCHAESNLASKASRTLSADVLSRVILYTSTEPCPMCAGAIYWVGIKRVVFGLSNAGLGEVTSKSDDPDCKDGGLHIPCDEIFNRSIAQVDVVGPVLEERARSVHHEYW